mgnify:CR=1 FL=1
MARTAAVLPEGSRITDYVSLGVISKAFPPKQIHDLNLSTQIPHLVGRFRG